MAFSCFPVPASLASPPCRCDHSLALLSWVSAHPFNKKKPYHRLLASCHTGVRPVGCTLPKRGYAPLGSREGLAVLCAWGLHRHSAWTRFRGFLSVAPFGFLRFSSPSSLIVMSVSARCCALLAAPGKWSLTVQLHLGLPSRAGF